MRSRGEFDIDELEVPRRAAGGTPITPRAGLQNRSAVSGSAVARLTVTFDGAPAYDQSLSVELAAHAEKEVTFPAYDVASVRHGKILWTLTVTDQDPDVDQASATTWVGKNTLAIFSDVTATGSTGAAGGCSSGGGGAGLLALGALGLLVLRRRARARA